MMIILYIIARKTLLVAATADASILIYDFLPGTRGQKVHTIPLPGERKPRGKGKGVPFPVYTMFRSQRKGIDSSGTREKMSILIRF